MAMVVMVMYYRNRALAPSVVGKAFVKHGE